MPSRSNVTRHETPIQGDDAWVEVESVTYGELKALTKEAKQIAKDEATDSTDANMRLTEKLITTKVRRWNWVDDDGNPLAFPKEHPEVVDLLTTNELSVLSALVMNTDEVKKKRTI
jgi:hypothetical protein